MNVTAQELVAAAKQDIREIDCSIAQSRLPQYLLLDVREPEEFLAGAIPGAINIPRGVLEFKIGNHPAFQQHDRDIIVYCQSGGRSALATQTLKKLGYSAAVSLAGGFNLWLQTGGERT